MDNSYEYDLEPWYQKRKMLWNSIQLKSDNHVDNVRRWRDHSQLHTLMHNADQYAMHILKEETNCRRLKRETTRHRKLVKLFEETVQFLEDSALMYQLMH